MGVIQGNPPRKHFLLLVTLSKIADPNLSIETEVDRSANVAHEANELLLNEQLIHDLRSPSTPVCNLRLADTTEMFPLLLGKREMHWSGSEKKLTELGRKKNSNVTVLSANRFLVCSLLVTYTKSV